MLQNIANIIGQKTKILCLLNGVGHESILQQYVPPENIIMGVTILTSKLTGPGKISFAGGGLTEIQNFVEQEDAKNSTLEIVSVLRSEERRVGKECQSQKAACHVEQKV